MDFYIYSPSICLYRFWAQHFYRRYYRDSALSSRNFKMTTFIFANSKMQKRKQRYHTPTTFRATKRLQFTNSPSISTMPTIHPPPPGVSPPRTTPGISSANSNIQTMQHSSPAINAFQLQPQYILPWDTPGSKTATLFKVKPPHLTYPAGSSDEITNNRFTKRMDMYLFSNFQGDDMADGEPDTTNLTHRSGPPPHHYYRPKPY